MRQPYSIKITAIVIGLFLVNLISYSQDSTTTPKTLYKIDPSKVSKKECVHKQVITANYNTTLISCIVNALSNEAVISIMNSNGVITNEKVSIKESIK